MHISRKLDLPEKLLTPDGEIIQEILGLAAGGTDSHSLAKITLHPGNTSARHFHKKSEESYLILSGIASLEINEEKFTLSAGEAVLIEPKEAHQIKTNTIKISFFSPYAFPPGIRVTPLKWKGTGYSTMKFAVNFSNPLIRLLKEEAVQIDLIKCPDWAGMLEEAQPYSPVTIHFDLDAGLGTTFNVDFDRIEEQKNQTETPHVNTHLVTPRTFDPDNPQELESINRLWREEIQLMIDQFGADSVALEHFPYTDALPNIRSAADSHIFSQVILDTGCMLLLDLAHARITADTLGIPVKDYVRALPLDRLVELHITGIKCHSGILTDHFELGESDWEILSWALGEIKKGNWREPEIVAFEYGGVGDVFVWRTDYDVLKTQVPKLYEMIYG